MAQTRKRRSTRARVTRKRGKTQSQSAIVKKAVRKATRSAFAQKVMAIVNRNEETKYVAQLGQNSSVIGQALVTPAALYPCLPKVAQSTVAGSTSTRIGDEIQPVRARVDFTFRWGNDNINNQDVVVNLWIVTIKGFNSFGAYASAPTGQFVRVGDSTNRDLNDPDQPLMLQQWAHAPLNTDQYTQLKHYRFRMRRGAGNQANQAASAGLVAPTGVTAGEDQRYISYTWEPPKLHYDDPPPGGPAPSNQPTSHCPLYGVYATNADGSAYGDTLLLSTRLHMWFKDS